MFGRHRIVVIVCGLLSVIATCLFWFSTSGPASPVVGEADTPESFAYSPFVLKLSSSEIPFDTITFKDVGVQTSEEPQFLYESLAESLSLELSRGEVVNFSSEVIYSEEILDPANHTSCGSKHIYVDVWTQRAPAMWGYSLWSGCEKESRFAWKQVPREDVEGLHLTLEPLTNDIADALREATTRDCFNSSC